MKKKILFPVFLLVTLLLSSCSSVKVVSDVDKTVNFSKYKTYSFLGWQKNSDQILNDFDKKRIKDAFKAELDKRGMSYVEEGGDINITLFIVISKETSTTAYTDYYSSGYPGYHRYRGGWGYGYSSTDYVETDYLKGTLVMDVFDSQSKNQVWQGIASSTVNEDPVKREKTIPQKVTALMKKFPIAEIE